MPVFKTVIALVCCIVSLIVPAQEQIQQYVREHSVKINSIQSEGPDYADFEAIGNAIGDASIVMLGEQDHGDAPAFLAKAKLIKYLHERKGFNVLAFENDFFSTNYEWELVKSGTLPVDRFLGNAINTLWTHCTVLNYFFRVYIPSTLKAGTPLEITGFDSQMGTRRLVPLLDSVLKALRIPMVQLPEYETKILPLLTTWYNYTNDTAACNRIIGYYTGIRTEMLDKLPKDHFWIVTIENLIQLVNQFKYWKKDFALMKNIRDRQMAANLKWLTTTKYPTEKIIVWAHNYHISKYAGHYPVKWANAFNPMGAVFTSNNESLRKTYILGFTSYQGTAGRLRTKIYKIEKPKPNSFENWINKDYQYAFVDFKQFNILNSGISEVFNMSGATLGNNRYHQNYPAEWNKIFDGIFYIRDMYPCER